MKKIFVQRLKGKMMTERKKIIYLDDALEAIRKLPNAGIHWLVSVESVFNALLKLSSAEPECRKGKWIANGDIPKECPFCGEDWDKYIFGDVVYTGELPKFCPNCGEDMRGEQE